MKKGGVALFLVLVLFFSIISVNFVSAGLLGDVWNKITGEVTENETGTSTIVEEICGDGICQEGEVCDIDCCEAFCTLYCPDGAVEGSCGCECIEPEPPEPGQEICCKIMTIAPGTTGAKIEYEQIIESECPPSELPDGTSYEIVADGYCVPEIPPEQCKEGEIKYYTCEDGTKIPECKCENDAWICKVSVKDDCPESPEPETCAGQIKITFNKNIYKIGDPVKIIIETFDSQGNHLPNYAFYGQMYDDRWHTPDLQKTDDEGYLIHTGIAEKPPEGVTEVKFKVYTKETSSCGSVEDTAEVKLELGECGVGGCVPRPECKDKIRMCGGKCPPCPEDENGEIFYPCRGCELEDKCYPYGYRKAGNYCLDENNMFANQLEDDATCENNFECKTNLCINGNCVSSNLWNKFLEWFKKLFGGDDDEEEPKECSKLLIEKDIGDKEYNQSLYGVSKETQAPLMSNECEQIGTIECCVAQYLENGNSDMGLMCPYDNRGDVENLVKCGVGDVGNVLEEYKGEKVIKMDEGKMMIWTYENYALAVGKMPEAGIPEDIADAYLKKYPSDLGEIDIGDVPPVEPESCEEIEDSDERDECYVKLAMKNSDAEICEKVSSSRQDKCYINVAEHTGDANICDKVVDSSLREKCYFWVAGQEGDVDVCEEMEDSTLQNECYVHVAEKTGDASFCDKITDIHIIDKCYRDVGIQTDDRSLCEKIIEDRAKQKCLDNTS